MSDLQLPDNWGLGHALAYIYLHFCVHTDGELDEAEVAMLHKKLGEWPHVEDAGQTMVEATQFWADRGDLESQMRFFVASVLLLKKIGDEDFLRLVHDDLKQLAMADNVVKEGEANWLALVEEQFGL